MSDAAKNEPMTRFLMYKIAIRCGEVELAAECLQMINFSSGKDSTLLCACVLDAQQVGAKTQTIAALQLVLDKYDYGAPSSVHLPSLLRITIRLTSTLLEEAKDGEGSEVNTEKLCKLLEGGKIYFQVRPYSVNPGGSCCLHAEDPTVRTKNRVSLDCSRA